MVAEDERAEAHAELARERWHSHNGVHEAEKEARVAALAAMEKRLDAMNEFRDQLRDQASTFVRTDTVERMESQFEHRMEELRTSIATEREERREQQNLRTGSVDTWKWLAGFLGVGGVGAVIWAILNAPK